MVDFQVISKIIATSSLSILQDNGITADYFPEYSEEIAYILEHYEKYGNVPDKTTFLNAFPDIQNLVEVAESDRYLVEKLREEYLYYRSVPVISRAAELLKQDSNKAAEYLINELKYLRPSYDIQGLDIIKQASDRYNQYLERKEHQDSWFMTCGFEELDDLMHGIQREEEFLVILARTNQGKSFVLEKMCTHVWEIGYNVGYISPEMSATSIGYRFDTLYKNYSNLGLMRGKDIDDAEYEAYIKDLETHDNKFLVATPSDFDRKITITRLKNWITANKLDLLAIDGITYLTDERYKKGDTQAVTLTNLSEDLMSLSVELHIPILVVVQANRGGVVANEDSSDTPELDTIRGSDGIAHNASKVLSIRQTKDNVLIIQVKKQRFGAVGGKVAYAWNIDTGVFKYMQMNDDEPTQRQERKGEKRKASSSKEDIF